MGASVFVNLCVIDVFKSRHFFESLGFEIVENYSDDRSYCIQFNEQNYLMMLGVEKYMMFSKNRPVDSFNHTEMIFSLNLKSREKIDEVMKKVVELGGHEIGSAHDDEFMYYRSFRDLDGHHFELFSMKEHQ
jgi:predicted lactoylglutathione lyase